MDNHGQLSQVQAETNIVGTEHQELLGSVQFLGGESVLNKRLSGFGFYYGWCGHFFEFDYSDINTANDVELIVPSNQNSHLDHQKKGDHEYQFPKDDSNYHHIQIKNNERIDKLLFREVDTTSYEFGTNIVGTIVVLNSGQVHVFDAKEYKNHNQRCWEIDLSQVDIIGARSVWNDASHYTVANLQLLLRHQKSIATPQFQQIAVEFYNEYQNSGHKIYED